MPVSGFRDYFNILGIDRNADTSTIKAAFRKLARTYHPDVNQGDPKAEAKFKEINEAYEILSDPDKRNRYEQYGKYWDKSFVRDGFSSFDFSNYENFDEFVNDLLGRFVGGGGATNSSTQSDFFRNSSKKPFNLDAEISLKITFIEAFQGSLRTLTVNREIIKVKIPKGIKTGTRLRVKEKGNLQPGIGRRGDLNINLEVQSHKIWRFEGNHLVGDLPVALDELLLGATVTVMTPDGEAQLVIPPSTLPDQRLRLKEKGWPINNSRGDLILVVKLELPEKWTKRELELLKELNELRIINPRKDWLKLACL